MKLQKESTPRIYLDDYILQKDMRIRLPKELIKNLNIYPGKTYFEIYFDPSKKEIILAVKNSD